MPQVNPSPWPHSGRTHHPGQMTRFAQIASAKRMRAAGLEQYLCAAERMMLADDDKVTHWECDQKDWPKARKKPGSRH